MYIIIIVPYTTTKYNLNSIFFRYWFYNDILFLDLNPAAQGSSLTEGKRNKRLKKQGGENGEGGRSSSPEDNNSELVVVQAPEKLAEDNVKF